MAIVERPREVPRELKQAQQRVLQRLDRVRRRLRFHLLVEGLFWLATAALGLAATSLVLDRLLRLNLSSRLGLLTLAALALGWVIVRRLLRPVCVRLDNLDLAELLDRRSPGVGQRITNVLQLPSLLADEHFASPSMVQAAVLECAQALDRVDLTSTLNVPRRRKMLLATGLWIGIALAYCFLAPQTASLWARRWLAGSNVRWPQQTYLSVAGLNSDGVLLVPRGELSVVQIGAQPSFEPEGEHWLLRGRDEPLVVEGDAMPSSTPPEQIGITYSMPDGTRRRGNATQFDAATFRYELPPLAEPIELDAAGGDDWLGPIRVEPIDRPAVSTLEITSRSPGAKQPHTQRVGDSSTQLLFLPETQLELRLVANQNVANAEALDKGSPLEGWQRVDERTYALRWTMKESLAIEFRLTGHASGLLSKPYFLAIGVLKDREPRVTIRSSGVGRRVTPVARIPLAMRATDDFGVASLALEWERTALRDDKPQVDTGRQALDEPAESEATEPAPGEPKSSEPKAAEPPALPLRTEAEWNEEWPLKALGLAAGNTLKLRGAALDASTVGPQAGQSRWLQFQIVASDELFYEILMRQREQRAKFALALESEKAQSVALGELAKPDDAVAVARAQQVIARQVGQIAVQLEATLVELTLNDLANQQARDNLQNSIITPMRSLHQDVLGRLRLAAEELSRGQTISDPRRTEAVELSQQAVEQMQKILGQMSLWESFIDVINQLKQVIERQDQVLKATEEIDKKRTDALFDE